MRRNEIQGEGYASYPILL